MSKYLENKIAFLSKLISKEQRKFKDLIYNCLIKAAEHNYLGVVQLLVRLGMNVNSQTSACEGTPLGRAIVKGHVEMVQLLCKIGADVNYINYAFNIEGYETPLLIAVENQQFDIVKLLVEMGANVNQPIEGKFPLMMAACLGNEEIFNYLAPLTVPDLRQSAEKRLPLGIAQREREKRADPRTNDLCDAVFSQDIEEVQKILNKGDVDINSFNFLGSSPLSCAICNRQYFMVKILLEGGADPNVVDDGNVQTPLIEIIGFGEKRRLISLLLISAGADVNFQTVDGETALMRAAFHGSLEDVEMLLQNGANVKLRNEDGKSALDYAIEGSRRDFPGVANLHDFKYDEIIELLVLQDLLC